MPSNVVNGFNIGGNVIPYNYDSLGNKLEKTSIAQIYSNTSTYSIDDYVIYNGILYKCVVAVETAENFDFTKWTECSTGTELNYIKKYYSINDGIKQALLNLLAHVAYTDEHGQDYYDELETELYRTADLVSISAVFNQGQNVIYDTDSLDTLKQYLVVTATYDDSSTATVTGYTLSGTLTVGTSTITVSYAGKTTTFDVTVTSFYLWKYEASSGELLSVQEYAEKTVGSEGGTETLENGALRLHTYTHATTSGSSYIRFGLIPGTATSALLRCYANFVIAPNFSIGSSSTGFRLQLSNGSGGAQAFIGQTDNLITIKYNEGATLKTIQTTISVSGYHLLELKMVNNQQTLQIDGQTIFANKPLSTNYTSASVIFNQAADIDVNPNGVTTDIQWVGYSEVV